MFGQDRKWAESRSRGSARATQPRGETLQANARNDGDLASGIAVPSTVRTHTKGQTRAHKLGRRSAGWATASCNSMREPTRAILKLPKAGGARLLRSQNLSCCVQSSVRKLSTNIGKG